MKLGCFSLEGEKPPARSPSVGCIPPPRAPVLPAALPSQPFFQSAGSSNSPLILAPRAAPSPVPPLNPKTSEKPEC